MRVTPSLSPLGTVSICTRTNNQTYPNIAYNNENYVVVWSDPWFSGATTRYLAVARVSPAGVVLDTGACVTGQSGSSEDNPDIAFDGSRCLVVWQKSGIIQGIFINSSGLPEGSVFTIATGSGPCIAFDGTDYAVAWYTGSYPSLNIQTRTVSTTGTLGTIATVTTDNDCNRWADITFDGTQYLLIWMKGVNSPTSQYIYGQFVSADGSLIGNEFLISDNSAGQRWFPTVANSDINYLIAYDQNSTSSNIYGNVDVEILGVEEDHTHNDMTNSKGATLCSGPLIILEKGKYKIFDIMGREIFTIDPAPGIYFIEIDGEITQKIVKIR